MLVMFLQGGGFFSKVLYHFEVTYDIEITTKKSMQKRHLLL